MTRPACLTNKRLPKEAKDYEIREREWREDRDGGDFLPEVVERLWLTGATTSFFDPRARFSTSEGWLIRAIIGRATVFQRALVSKIAAACILLRDTLWFFLDCGTAEGQEIAVNLLCG